MYVLSQPDDRGMVRLLHSEQLESRFSLAHVKEVLGHLLGRRARTTGLVRHVVRRICVRSCYSYDMGGTSFKVVSQGGSGYVIEFSGDVPESFLHRINRDLLYADALEATRRLSAERRSAQRVVRTRKKHTRQLPCGPMTQHLRKTDIPLGAALTVVGMLAPRLLTPTSLCAAPYRQGDVIGFRLGADFVLRIEGVGTARLVDTTRLVRVYSTKGNKHPLYRRLRRALRKVVGYQSRARVSADAGRHAAYQARCALRAAA